MAFNKLLQRQISKIVDSENDLSEKYLALLQVISDSYDHHEKDRKMIERSLELSSEEMVKLNSDLRKETEEATKANNELKTLFENIEEVFFSIDMVQNKLLHISPACEKVYGYSKESFYQNPELWKQLILKEDVAILKKILPLAITGSKFHIEYRVHHFDGSIRYLESKITPTLNTDGKILRMDGVTDDITERKKSELAAFENKNKYQELFEKMIDGVYKSSYEGKFIEVNPALVKMLGYNSKEELLAIDIKSQLYFDTADREEAVIKDKTEGESVFRLRRKDGSEIWVEDRGQYVTDEKGNVLYHEGTLRDITKRIQTELQLHRSEKETTDYRKALDQSLMVSITDQKGIIKYANDNFCNISKYSMSELLEQDHRILNSGQHSKDFFKNLWETIVKGNVWRGEIKNKAKDGTFFWADATIVPFLNEDGMPYQYLAMRTDITEKKNDEIKIAESEEIFRTIIQSSNDLIQSANTEGKFEFVNESWLKTLGYTKEELPAVNVFDIICEEHLPNCKKIFQKVMNGESLSNIKTTFISKAGEKIILEGNAVPRFKDNKVVGTQAFFRDVTEREIAEEKNRKIENRFRSLIENNADAISLLDKQSNIIYQSPSIERMLGFTFEERQIKTGLNYIHPDDLNQARIIFAEVLKNPFKAFSFQHRKLHKDGHYIWTEGIITNMLEDESVNAIVANFRDITERKEQQDALENSNKELRKSNLELDRFVYCVSHDLRAPLLSMQGIVGITAEETKEDMTGEHMQMLDSSIIRLDNLIGEILDYSRNTRTELTKDTINFNDLLQNIIDNFKHINSGNKPVEILMEINEAKTFYSDKERLKVVLTNLISNAILYHNPKTETPFVKICIDSNDDITKIDIEDNGIGISEKNHSKIFEMFYRISEKSIGSGLGLYIVKETIEKLNGNISLESKPEIGTKFTLSIPNLLYQ